MLSYLVANFVYSQFIFISNHLWYEFLSTRFINVWNVGEFSINFHFWMDFQQNFKNADCGSVFWTKKFKSFDFSWEKKKLKEKSPLRSMTSGIDRVSLTLSLGFTFWHEGGGQFQLSPDAMLERSKERFVEGK